MGLLSRMAGVVFGTTLLATADYGVFNMLANDDDCYFVLRCLPDKQYREAAVSEQTMFVEHHGWDAVKPDEPYNPGTYRETNFSKAWLEYSEVDGKAFDPAQEQAILQKIAEMGSQNKPLHVVVFVHGWHNNAAPIAPGVKNDVYKFDYFMARQTDQLRRLYEQRGVREIPEVLGIYVGWRGESIYTPLFNFLTISTRAAIADKVAMARGENSLYNALQNIASAARAADPEMRMMVIGHSYGGRLVSRMFLGDIAAGTPEPLGPNTVEVVLEPAIGADCYDALMQNPASDVKKPSFLSISSGDDWALSGPYNWVDFAIKDCDDASKAKGVTIGNFPDYITHQMTFESLGYLDLTARPDITSPDGSPQFPPAGSDKNWYQVIEDRHLAYSLFDMNYPYRHIQNSYNVRDADTYRMAFDAAAKAGHVWNIRTDSDTIGYVYDTESPDATHNGYLSTNLSRLLTEYLYSEAKAISPPRL